MKIDAKITMLFRHDGMDIEIHDDDADVTFCKIHLTQEQTCQALSRLSHTTIDLCEVHALDVVGKKREYDTLEFLFEDHGFYNGRGKRAYEEAQKVCPAGWEASGYFGSQGSFFQKDGKQYASCTIYRWVDK
jgi:hypothetical protein